MQSKNIENTWLGNHFFYNHLKIKFLQHLLKSWNAAKYFVATF